MINGFADLHNHQFSYLAFGGKFVHGRAFGPISQALPWCDYDRTNPDPRTNVIHGPGGVADLVGSYFKGMYGSPSVGHAVGGFPLFDGWPLWDSVTHQAVYEDWLLRAVQGGLRLMVMLAVNNETLCQHVNTKLSCPDMEAVDRQLAEAKAMEAYIDAKPQYGPGKGWYRIVRTPQEARVVMQAGQLAVVLGIEVDNLFNSYQSGGLTVDELRKQLDHYNDMGVRHFFPIHFIDNAFGGTAFQNDTERGLIDDPTTYKLGLATAVQANMPLAISALNPALLGPIEYACTVHTEDATAFGYEYRTSRRNVQGLTPLGKTLIHEMIARGMIIDVDHMSARSKADVFDICEAAQYPVVAGHVGFVEISHGAKSHEGQWLPAEIERLRRLGGMIGIIPHQGESEEIDTWQAPGQSPVPHLSGNTSNTLVQVYRYAAAKMQGGPVAFGTDLNGLAGLPRPRFGPDAVQNDQKNLAKGIPPPTNMLIYPFTAIATGAPMDRSVVGAKSFDFNLHGLSHVGMLPALIADFQAMGVSSQELDPLMNSAEGYVLAFGQLFVTSSGARRAAPVAGAACGLGRSAADHSEALARTAELTRSSAGRLSARVRRTGGGTELDQKGGECATDTTWREVLSRQRVVPG